MEVEVVMVWMEEMVVRVVEVYILEEAEMRHMVVVAVEAEELKLDIGMVVVVVLMVAMVDLLTELL